MANHRHIPKDADDDSIRRLIVPEVTGSQWQSEDPGFPNRAISSVYFFLFVHNKVKFNLTELLQNQRFGNDIAYGFIPTVYI